MSLRVNLPTRTFKRSILSPAVDMKAADVSRAAVHFGIDTGKSGGKIPAVVVYRTSKGAIFDLKKSESQFGVPLDSEKDRKFIHTGQMLPMVASNLVAANDNLVIGEGDKLSDLMRLVTVDTFGSGAAVTGFRPMYDYLDPQWIKGMDEAVRLLGGDRQKAMRHIFDGGAGQFGCGVYLLYHLLGMRAEETRRFPQHAQIISLPEMMSAGLSQGGRNAIDESWARLTLFADRTGLAWNRDLLERLGLSLVLPQIQKSGTKLGDLRNDILRAMEADKGEVILGALHDSAGAFAFFTALGGLETINVSSGSWNIIGMPVRVEELERQDFRDAMFERGMGVEGATGAEYVVQNVMGSMLTDPLFSLFNVQRGDFGSLFSGIEGEDVGFAYVNCLSDIFSRAFDPEKPETLLAAIKAYCEKTGQMVPQTREEVAKTMIMSMLMGMADRVREYTKLMAMLGREPKSIQVGGGLLMKNDLLCQALASATGLVVKRMHTRVAGLGNTMLALKGAGLFSDEEIRFGLERVSSGVTFNNWLPDKPMWQRAFDEYMAVKTKE